MQRARGGPDHHRRCSPASRVHAAAARAHGRAAVHGACRRALVEGAHLRPHRRLQRRRLRVRVEAVRRAGAARRRPPAPRRLARHPAAEHGARARRRAPRHRLGQAAAPDAPAGAGAEPARRARKRPGTPPPTPPPPPPSAAATAPAASAATEGGGTSALALVQTADLAAGAGGGRAVEKVKLTRRERTVLERVGEGMLNKEIAADLGVEVARREVRAASSARRARRTAPPVRRALQLGLLSDDPMGEARRKAPRKPTPRRRPTPPSRRSPAPRRCRRCRARGARGDG